MYGFLKDTYDVLRDQGSLIAGMLALFAGWLAYKAGVKQADAAKQQSIQLRDQERRQEAQRVLSACALIGGILRQLKGEVDHLIGTLMQPDYNNAASEITYALARNLALPPVGTVWNELGLLFPDTVRAYFQLDFRINDIRGRFPIPATELRDELRNLDQILDFLFDEISKMSKRQGERLLKIFDYEARNLTK